MTQSVDCWTTTLCDVSQACPKKVLKPSASEVAVTEQFHGVQTSPHSEENGRKPDGLLLHDNAAVVLLAWVLASSCRGAAACSTVHAACRNSLGLLGSCSRTRVLT